MTMPNAIEVQQRIEEALTNAELIETIVRDEERKYQENDLPAAIVAPGEGARNRLSLGSSHYAVTRDYLIVYIYAILDDAVGFLSSPEYEDGWERMEVLPQFFLTIPHLETEPGAKDGIAFTIGMLDDAAPTAFPFKGGVYAAIQYVMTVVVHSQ